MFPWLANEISMLSPKHQNWVVFASRKISFLIPVYVAPVYVRREKLLQT